MSACSVTNVSANKSGPIPNPTIDAPLAKVKGEQTAVLAGGCFWGIEAVYEHVKGVTRVESGMTWEQWQELASLASEKVLSYHNPPSFMPLRR